MDGAAPGREAHHHDDDDEDQDVSTEEGAPLGTEPEQCTRCADHIARTPHTRDSRGTEVRA